MRNGTVVAWIPNEVTGGNLLWGIIQFSLNVKIGQYFNKLPIFKNIRFHFLFSFFGIRGE